MRARVKDGATWSALMEATFYIQQDFTPLAITEIMFNPPGAGAVSGDEFEFLELKNTGREPARSERAYLLSGITFTFPGGTSLGAGQFFVLARNAAQIHRALSRRDASAASTLAGSTTAARSSRSRIRLARAILVADLRDHVPWPIAPRWKRLFARAGKSEHESRS